MNIVSLPVSRVSFKILTKLYGKPPFKLNRQDILWVQANFNNYNYKLKEASVRELLSERIELYINANDFKGMYRSGLYAGHCLNKYHLLMMCQFVHAQSMAGCSISSSLDNFYSLYDISEDDYGKDTAYKRIQRYNWSLGADKKPVKIGNSRRARNILIPRPVNIPDTLSAANNFVSKHNIIDEDIQKAIQIRLLLDASLQNYADIKSLLHINNNVIKRCLAAYERWIFRKKTVRDDFKVLVSDMVK